MSQHLTAEQIDDFVDGALDTAEHEQWRGHLVSCADCRAEVEGVQRLLERVHALPQAVRPPRDLLADVHAAIDAQQVVPFRPGRTHTLWSMRGWLATAALLLIVATALITRSLTRQGIELQAPVASNPGGASLVNNELRGLEASYLGAIAELQALIDANHAELASGTRALLEENLRIIDRAIRESRRVVEQEPGNEMVTEMLRSSYEKKLDLLRRATVSAT